MFVCAAWAAQHGRSSVRPLGTRLSLEHSFRNSRARVLLVDEGPPLAKVSPKPLDIPGSKMNLRRHGYQIL